MQLESLVCFYEIANGKTYLEVAERHHMSQSVLSKSIKKLEVELGFPLFDRSSRRVRLTPAGWQVMQDLDGICVDYERLMGHIAQVNNTRRISIWITLPGRVLGLKSIISDFERENPHILLSVGQTRHDPRMLSGMEPYYEAESDFIVMHRPLGSQGDSAGDELYEDAVVALIPKGHPLYGKPSLRFSDLADRSVLVNFWGKSFLPELEQYTGTRLEKVSAFMESREDLFWMCRDSGVVALFYASDMYMSQPQDFVMRTFDDLPAQPIVLVRSRNVLSPQAECLRQYILNAVSKNEIRLMEMAQRADGT